MYEKITKAIINLHIIKFECSVLFIERCGNADGTIS